MANRSEQLSSTFGSIHVGVSKPSTHPAVEDSPYANILKPLDSNKNSAVGSSKRNHHLNNQLYIEAFSEKDNYERIEQTRKATIYEKERRIIDLEEENFKLRSQIMGGQPVRQSQQPQHPSPDNSLAEKEYQLKVESLTKQYELRLQKQQELYQLQIWKLKEDIESLSYQLRNSNAALEAHQAACNQSASCQTDRQQPVSYQPDHCPICSDGQIIDRMCKMHNALEDDHNLCLKYRKQTTIKLIHLEQELDDARRQLEKELRQQAHLKATYEQLQLQCRELVQQKNELDSSNIKLIQENARHKLKEDQLKIREEHIKLREIQTNRSMARSETAENLLQLHPPPTTKSALPMKGSIIDRLQGGNTDFRRPGTSVNKMNTTGSYDLPERNSVASYQHTSFQRKVTRAAGSIERLKEQPAQYTLTQPSLTPSNPALAAILSTSSHHNLDTFRPNRKHTPSYKYNV